MVPRLKPWVMPYCPCLDFRNVLGAMLSAPLKICVTRLGLTDEIQRSILWAMDLSVQASRPSLDFSSLMDIKKGTRLVAPLEICVTRLGLTDEIQRSILWAMDLSVQASRPSLDFSSLMDIKKGTRLVAPLEICVTRLGLEPRTHTLKVYCSTN